MKICDYNFERDMEISTKLVSYIDGLKYKSWNVRGNEYKHDGLIVVDPEIKNVVRYFYCNDELRTNGALRVDNDKLYTYDIEIPEMDLRNEESYFQYSLLLTPLELFICIAFKELHKCGIFNISVNMNEFWEDLEYEDPIKV